MRWTALLILMLDSTNVVVGLLAPDALVLRPSVPELVQTALGLSACAFLIWWRWRWAAVAMAALVSMVLWHGPVGIELNVLIVGAVAVASAVRPRMVGVSLAGWVGFAALLGWARHQRDGVDWHSAVLIGSLLAVLGTSLGLVAARFLRERQEAQRSLHRLRAENVRIRADERLMLSGELQSILTRDFRAMRATARAMASTRDTGDLRRLLAHVGEQGRSTLATVRVVLRTLRAEPEQATSRAPRGRAWIDALETPLARTGLRLVCLAAAAAALVMSVWAGTDGARFVVLDMIVAVLSPMTLVAALWRLRLGYVLALMVLLVGLLVPSSPLWLGFPVALLCFTAARTGRWRVITPTIAALIAYAAAHLLRHGTAAGPLVGVLEVVGAGSFLLGLSLCHFESVRSSTRVQELGLLTERARIARSERTEVARELHDVVGHQLSVVSLQALAAEDEQDPASLRTLGDRVEDALESGAAEIDGLVRALHSTQRPISDCASDVAPTAMASDLARQLRGHHYRARFSLDPRLDRLDATTRRTLARILQESGTNVLRHAPRGASCSFTAMIDDGTLSFVARSPLPTRMPNPNLSAGYGLRGIRERVDLTGGTFFAGSRDGCWEVRVGMCVQTDVNGARAGRSLTGSDDAGRAQWVATASSRPVRDV